MFPWAKPGVAQSDVLANTFSLQSSPPPSDASHRMQPVHQTHVLETDASSWESGVARVAHVVDGRWKVPLFDRDVVVAPSGHPSQCIVHEAHDVLGTLRGDARVEQTEVVVQDRPIDLPALEETRNLSMYLYVGMARGEHVDRAVCVVEAEPRVTCRRRMGEYPMVPVEHRIPDRAARLLQHAARGVVDACDVDDRVPHIVRQLHACVSSLRSVEEARGAGGEGWRRWMGGG